MDINSAKDASTFFHNLSVAARSGETISVGGGTFSPEEIHKALAYVHDMRETLVDAQKCIAKACAEDAYKDCIVPTIGESTYNKAHALTKVYAFPHRLR